jgi:hypothetical protein
MVLSRIMPVKPIRMFNFSVCLLFANIIILMNLILFLKERTRKNTRLIKSLKRRKKRKKDAADQHQKSTKH